MNKKNTNIIQNLNELLQDNDFIEFEKLLKKEFNIFKFMGIENREIYYSKVLCNLLDPYEKHGLGELFLREFLKVVLADKRRAKKLRTQGIEYIDVDCGSFNNVSVSTERPIAPNSSKRPDRGVCPYSCRRER